MSKIIEQAEVPKIPLPPFMHKLQDMMAGGIPLGVIVNLSIGIWDRKARSSTNVCTIGCLTVHTWLVL